MTYQTDGPLADLRLGVSASVWEGVIGQVQKAWMTLDAPYQRGHVWTREQRIMLIKSILTGTPIPTLIINDRPDRMWSDSKGNVTGPAAAVIDGKQRITTVEMFYRDDLAVPASWFEARMVERTEMTGDGPYVRWSGLNIIQQRRFNNSVVPVAHAQVGSVEAEAEIYLRVNGTGTAQTAADLANAARVAGR
jgi:hypothetical protein